MRVPLYVHFPGGRHAGVRVEHETEVYDVTATVLSSLGLAVPDDMRGADLLSIAGGIAPPSQRIRVAVTHELYSARWGDFVLRGSFGKRPRLCWLSVDPTCAYDRTHLAPAVAQVLFRRLVASDQGGPRGIERERLRLTPEQSSWLDVWGSYYENL